MSSSNQNDKAEEIFNGIINNKNEELLKEMFIVKK